MKNVIKSLLFGLCIMFASCDEIDPSVAFITYDNLSVTESDANDGSVSATITITVSGDTFKETLTEEDDYAITGLLNGLTATLTRVNSETLTLEISGTLTNDVGCALETVGLNIYGSAVSSGSRPQNASVDVSISFTGASYALSGTAFTETSANCGELSGTATVTLAGDGTVTADSPLISGTNFTTSPDVPDGLSMNVTVPDASTINLNFIGSATSNEASDSTSISVSFYSEDDLTKSPAQISPFSAGAFCDNAPVIVPLTLTFDDNDDLTTVTTSGGSTLDESDPADDGTIENSITIVLSNGTFDAAIDGGDVSIAYETDPGGTLATDVTYLNATTITFTLTGAAMDSTDADDTAATLTILPSALATGEFCSDADEVDITIDFIN